MNPYEIKKAIIENNRKKYAKPRREVERMIARQMKWLVKRKKNRRKTRH